MPSQQVAFDKKHTVASFKKWKTLCSNCKSFKG